MAFPETHVNGEQWDGAAVTDLEARTATYVNEQVATIPIGPQGPPYSPQGVYAGGTTYAKGDVVTYGGFPYASLIAGNVGNQPDTHSADWLQLLSLPSSVGIVSSGSSNQLPTLYAPAPTGVASIDTPVLQALLNLAITGSAADSRTPPMSRGAAARSLELAPGTYKVNAKLEAYGAIGLNVRGAGPFTTFIQYAGAGVLDALLDTNGCSYCNFEGFCLDGGVSTVNYPTCLLNVDAVSTVASGSSEFNNYRNIILQGVFVNGLQYGATGADNSQDVYHHLFEHCSFGGGQNSPWSDATHWQRAVVLGKHGAAPANVLMPTFLNCNAFSCVTGVEHNAVGAIWIGGATQENKADIQMNGTGLTDVVKYEGFRSENSGMLYNGPAAGGSCQQVSLRDIGWITSTQVVADRVVVRHGTGGHFIMENVTLLDTQVGDNLQIAISNGALCRFANLSISRADADSDPAAWLVNAGAFWAAQQVATLNPATGVISAHVNTAQTSDNTKFTFDANYTVTTNDRRVIMGTLTAPRTITLPDVTLCSFGYSVVIKDESGNAGTFAITVAAHAGQFLENAAGALAASRPINTNMGYVRLYTDQSAWYVET